VTATPASEFRACGKRRSFSPGAAASHSQYARVHTEFVQKHTFYFYFLSSAAWEPKVRGKTVRELGKKVGFSRLGQNLVGEIFWIQPADPKILGKKIGFNWLNPNF